MDLMDFDLIQLVDDDELERQRQQEAAEDVSSPSADFIYIQQQLLQQQQQPAAASCHGDSDVGLITDADRPSQPNDRLENCDISAPTSCPHPSQDEAAAAAVTATSAAFRQLPNAAAGLRLHLPEPPRVYRTDGGIRGTSTSGCVPRVVLSLGVMQIVVGLLALPIAVVAIVYCAYLAYVGHGMWTAAMSVASGISAICAWLKQSMARMVFHVILSTVATVCSALMTALSIYAAVVDSHVDFMPCPHRNVDVSFLIDMLLSITGCVQLIVAIVNAVMACKICCSFHRIGQPPSYYASNDAVVFDGVRCWTRTDTENVPPPAADAGDMASPPPYTLPPYSPPEMPPPYK